MKKISRDNELLRQAMNRVAEIAKAEDGFFKSVADFLHIVDENAEFIEKGGLKSATLEELQRRNRALYEDVLTENYDKCYGNPAYAVKELGQENGQLLCWLYRTVRKCVHYSYAGAFDRMYEAVQLFLSVYDLFASKDVISRDELRTVCYKYAYDTMKEDMLVETQNMLGIGENRVIDIVNTCDFNDIRYIYSYGDYISENEIETAKYLANLPEETIATMADTFSEGYRIGFEVTGKDLSKKNVAEVLFHVGFERMMRRVVANFAKLGLKTTIRDAYLEAGNYNRQFLYDHKDDHGLFLDKDMVEHMLTVRRETFEPYRTEARGYAGPAVVETFGEEDFNPVNKPERVKLNDEQNRLWVELISKRGAITREYIIQEERSFCIIAFPVPEVGPVFKELFDETIKINTLDYMLYRNVQQTIIDALDTADYCVVKGCGKNRTDLKVNLWKLKDATKETIFENCVADVNIPVGEVFTSPVLEGTNGVLHVTKVFLNGLEYRDLAITFEEGMIKNYTCANFENEEENINFVKDNILFRQETLPIGEFAIGTNTAAYVMARRLGVEAKLPILIAEKTGPHFAVGDTCYSHSEDTVVYNPDGKEIVARDNSKSILRKTDPSKAYFNCHTDITIPYDELGELSAVAKDGSKIVIIENGRFVLPGTEVLNEAFEE